MSQTRSAIEPQVKQNRQALAHRSILRDLSQPSDGAAAALKRHDTTRSTGVLTRSRPIQVAPSLSTPHSGANLHSRGKPAGITGGPIDAHRMLMA